MPERHAGYFFKSFSTSATQAIFAASPGDWKMDRSGLRRWACALNRRDDFVPLRVSAQTPTEERPVGSR